MDNVIIYSGSNCVCPMTFSIASYSEIGTPRSDSSTNTILLLILAMRKLK
jgi:hypothetical protein